MKINLLAAALLFTVSSFSQKRPSFYVEPAGKMNVNDIRSNKNFLNEPQRSTNEKIETKKNDKAVATEPKTIGAKTSATSISWKVIAGSSNCYGQLVSNSQPLQYNPDLNVVSYVHRNSGTYSATPTVPAGTESGIIVAEISSDWGATWDSTCIWAGSTNAARYPQGAVYSAPSNTNISNAYVVGSGITIDGSDIFNGGFYASKQLGVPGSTLYNTTASTVSLAQQFLSNQQATYTAGQARHGYSRYGFTSTSDGVVRSMGFVANDLDLLTEIRGAAIVKGTFAAGVFNWTTDTLIPSTIVTTSGDKVLGFDIQQAWNQSGTIGYGVMIGALPTATRSNRGYQPIIFKTTNSGGSWTQISGIDFNAVNMNNVTDHLATVGTGTNAYAIPYFNTFDLAVDSAGKLHIGALVASGAIAHNDSLSYVAEYTLSINGPNKKYQWGHVAGQRPYIYDFVGDGSGPWRSIMIDSMSSEDPGAVAAASGFAENPWDDQSGKINMDSRLQLARTPDGKYITFSWAESDTNFTIGGVKYNILPNIKTRILLATGSGTSHTCWVGSTEINVSKPAAGQGTVNANVASRASLHYMSPVTSNATVVPGIGHQVVDVNTPLTVTNSNPWSQLTNNATWYTSARLSYTVPIIIGGVNELSRENFAVNIFPNPTDDKVNLIFEMKESAKADVSVYDIVGKEVKHLQMNTEIGSNEISFDVSDLNSGIYFVKLSSGNVQVTRKLVVE